MLTDEEVDSLAKELLKESIDQVLTWDPDYFHEIYEMDEGELVPVYGATSVEGYGSFLCEYMPLEVIKKIIRDSERIFDEFEIVSSDKKSGLEERRRIGEVFSDARETSIRFMAGAASLNLIAFFRAKIADLLEEATHDCTIIAHAALAAAMAEGLAMSDPSIPVKADARVDIEEAAKRVADKKRQSLRGHIEGLPHILARRGRGRPPGSTKPPDRTTQEAAAFENEVEQAIRTLLSAESGLTKTAVAKALGLGGLSYRTGVDSSLNVFIKKLC